MKYLITGGTGFVGNNLARKLISQENNVGLLIREQSKTWRTKDLSKKIDFLKGDLTDKESLQKILGEYEPDFIYHFGSYGTYPKFQKDKSKIISVNIEGTLNLIEAKKDTPMMNIGSSSEYGIKNSPMKEEDKCNPDNLYGKTKLMQTLYCREQNIPTLRLFSVYGPWEESTRLIPVLINSKINGKDLHLINSKREYAYIDDIAEAIMNAAKKYDKIKGEIINIGSGKQHSMKDVLKTLNKIDSKRLNINWDFNPVQTEPRIWVADVSKAKEILGWKPKTSLEEGLKRSYEWWKKWKN